MGCELWFCAVFIIAELYPNRCICFALSAGHELSRQLAANGSDVSCILRNGKSKVFDWLFNGDAALLRHRSLLRFERQELGHF